jgi:hypothetical protein
MIESFFFPLPAKHSTFDVSILSLVIQGVGLGRLVVWETLMNHWRLKPYTMFVRKGEF